VGLPGQLAKASAWFASAQIGRRWGLGVVLTEMLSLGALASDEALDVARQILGGNAARLYGLPWAP
jgi:hypothetical protein